MEGDTIFELILDIIDNIMLKINWSSKGIQIQNVTLVNHSKLLINAECVGFLFQRTKVLER